MRLLVQYIILWHLILIWNIEVSVISIYVKCFCHLTQKKYVCFPLEHAEADCFFCFTALMSEIRDFFIKTLDDSEGGIKFMMAKLANMLKEKDPEIYNKLKEQELHPQYYSFRYKLY